MNTHTLLLIGFSVFIPGVTGLVRLKKISRAYYPFLFRLWLGCLNEAITYYLIQNGTSNAVNANLFFLAESLLLLYQFYCWKVFQLATKLYALLATVLLLAWSAEVFIFRSIRVFASYFIILHAFVISLLSIHMINRLLGNERTLILKNPIVIICICFIVYFTYAVLVEAFYLYGLSASLDFQKSVMRVMTFINLLINLFYAVAILWMPKKQRFSLSF